MDPCELLQVSMVEDDNPMEIPAACEDKTDDATSMGFDGSYPSITVSSEELNYYETLFSDIDSVKYKKLHCTACNIHMGTSPISHLHRYEHPLLKVLICEQCYNFYSSGDFEKDADGSELYCRWCGQGGQVYCCAKCPFVFCKKCIRRNIGQSMVTHIESSEDWLCYACDPKSIWMLRGLNWALKKYSTSKMSIPTSKRNEQDHKDVITDYSMCCKDRLNPANKTKMPANKKISTNSNHIDNQGKAQLVPKTERLKIQTGDKQSGSFVIQNNSKLRPILPKNDGTKSTDEVVCTPDIIAIDDESPPTSPKFNKLKPEPAPKKFLQVKPASKLIDPVKNDSKTYKTIQYSTSLVSTPVNLQTLQNNPVVSGMIQNLQKHLRPGEPQKIIKIVSPDGRAFLIDPMKVPTASNITATPTVVATPTVITTPTLVGTATVGETNTAAVVTSPINTNPPPLHVIKQNVPNTVVRLPIHRTQLWFDNNINGLQKISQLISTMIVNLVNDHKNLCNWVTLYNNFQTHLKTLTDNVEKLKLQVRNEYLQTVQFDNPNSKKTIKTKNNSDFGQHFLSPYMEENHTEPMLTSPTIATSSVLLLNTPQQSVIPIHSNHLPTVNMENTISNSNTNILKSMLDKPENVNDVDQDIPDDVMIDPKDLLEQTLEVGEGTIDDDIKDSSKVTSKVAEEESEDEEIDEEKIKKLKQDLIEIQKEIAKRKTENHKRKSEKKSDEIFDMDVTCDSDDNKSEDESDHSLFSIKSSNSDSDCVVVNENETKKRKVRRKNKNRISNKHEIQSSNLTPTIDEIESSDNRIRKKRKLENNDFSSEVVVKKIKVDENIIEKIENSKNTDTKTDVEKSNSEIKRDDETENKIFINKTDQQVDKINEIADNKNDSAVHLSDKNISAREKIDIENQTSEENKIIEDTDNNKSASSTEFNQSDLLSIANAIRESIIESRNLTKPKKMKPKVTSDIEKFLSSNIVFKKNDNENGETSATPKPTEKFSGNSYGDAFSNFLATVADDNKDNEVADEKQSEGENLDNNSHADSINSVKNNLTENKHLDELSKLESDVLALQRIAENIIANVANEH